LFKDRGLFDLAPVTLHCDNQAVLHIAHNLGFYKRTKHIEIDCHYIRDQLKAKKTSPTFVHTKEQLADVFTKALSVQQHKLFLSNLGVFNLFQHPT